jgi:PAS domain S-box-containing protein
MKRTSFLNRKVQASLFIAVLMLVAATSLAYKGMALSSESVLWVEHSHDVLQRIDSLLSVLDSIESSYRGALLPGARKDLGSYNADIRVLHQDETALQHLLVDNPSQTERLSALDRLVTGYVAETDAMIRLRETKGAEATEQMLLNEHSRLTANLQHAVHEFRDEEERLLKQREKESERRFNIVKCVIFFGSLLGLLLATVSAWKIRRDNVSRGATEQALRESEAKYRMLVDSVTDYAIFVLNPDGTINSWNAGAQKILGYSAEEMMGLSFAALYPPEDVRRGWPEEVLRLTAAEGHHEEQGMRLRKNGKRFLATVTSTALYGPDGELIGYSKVARDLSESKESGAKYRGLLEAAPDAMVVVDALGQIVLVNVQTEKQFGYRRDELLGQPVKNIIPEGFAERLIADALRSAEDAVAQQIGMGIELSGRRKDGSEFPIEIMLSPLESSEGILVTTAIRDITWRKRAEAQLLHKVAELNRSNIELGQFAYIASHDLQEPLRMVASYTQLLARRYKGRLDSDADDFIAYAVDGASRMQRLIRDLLTFSRVETTGKEMVATSSEEALEQAILNLRGAVQESDAVITHDPLPDVLADEMQLVQLFQNLVGNGIKYTRARAPLIHVSVEVLQARCVFSVKDNGLGIDPQYFEKIFGMFQRLHKREEFAGTGIGLAICKKIVERHGGDIWVESQPGSGSTFRFSLTESKGTA